MWAVDHWSKAGLGMMLVPGCQRLVERANSHSTEILHTSGMVSDSPVSPARLYQGRNSMSGRQMIHCRDVVSACRKRLHLQLPS